MSSPRHLLFQIQMTPAEETAWNYLVATTKGGADAVTRLVFVRGLSECLDSMAKQHADYIVADQNERAIEDLRK